MERETSNERWRYRLLETIRAFATERLTASVHDSVHEVQLRHRDFLLDLAEDAVAHIEDADFDDWLARLAIDNDNLRAALVFNVEEPDGAVAALRFARALEESWVLSGAVSAQTLSASLWRPLRRRRIVTDPRQSLHLRTNWMRGQPSRLRRTNRRCAIASRALL